MDTKQGWYNLRMKQVRANLVTLQLRRKTNFWIIFTSHNRPAAIDHSLLCLLPWYHSLIWAFLFLSCYRFLLLLSFFDFLACFHPGHRWWPRRRGQLWHGCCGWCCWCCPSRARSGCNLGMFITIVFIVDQLGTRAHKTFVWCCQLNHHHRIRVTCCICCLASSVGLSSLGSEGGVKSVNAQAFDAH